MSAITTIQAADGITSSRTVINTNFSNLNTDKIETSVLDTDTTLAANSDLKIATQKAVKAYIDSQSLLNTSKSGVSAGPAAASTQTITHTLGRTPIVIRVHSHGDSNTVGPGGSSAGTYNSTGNRCVYYTAGNGIRTAATSTTFAIRFSSNSSGSEATPVTGTIQNVTNTTFDIVWSAALVGAAFVWEVN